MHSGGKDIDASCEKTGKWRDVSKQIGLSPSTKYNPADCWEEERRAEIKL